ncbi:MAG: 5-deoxy-glucuronate isomerase [Victivallales bacterium]
MTEYHPENWKHPSSDDPGFHQIITPENSECRVLKMFRLNLPEGQRFEFDLAGMEINATVISGECILTPGNKQLKRFDSFYLPGDMKATVQASAPAVLYIGGATYEGSGDFFVRHFNPALPPGKIRQIHGEPPFEREVFMTLNQEVPASRLIAGLTWSRNGAWTSWPPHQHEQDLEEVYCYFDIPSPRFGLHLSYTSPGARPVPHVVSSGDFVEAPVGYHPTVAPPGGCNAYFWVLAALRKSSRRYDLAIEDKNFK